MELQIRTIEARDLEEVDRIIRLAFGTFLGLPDPMTVFGDRDFAHTRYRADPDSAFVAEADGRVVGSNFLTHWGSFGSFGPLTIEPRLWGKGIAQRLLEPTLQRLDAWGCSSAGLFTFSNSTTHAALYQKFGFWARFLTAVMSKGVAPAPEADAGGWALFSGMSAAEKIAALASCRETTGLLHAGLDVTREIVAVDEQKLGDTVLRLEDSKVSALAVCHVGGGTEAGSGNCYVKFGCARPGRSAPASFESLLANCEALAAARGASRLAAGVNLSHHEAYRIMLALGLRTDIQGVAMHRDNEPGFCRPGLLVIDDWR